MTEEALAGSAGQIVENIPALVLGLRRDGTVVLFNRSCEQLTGFARAQVVGKPVTGTVMKESGWSCLASCFPARGAGYSEETCEVPLRRADGAERLIQWRCSEGPTDGGADAEALVLCSGVDITDRRRLERQLLQAEKLSALGQLIAGVAHELNNPLTGVIGYSQIVAAQSDCPEGIRKDLENISKNAKRCKGVVDNLLRFARQHKPERTPTNVNSILDSTVELMAYHFRVANIEVAREFTQPLPLVMADFNELQQVVVNIASNAIHAMKNTHGRGRLTLRTSASESKLRVEIADDGPGIPPEAVDRIFDPFFTTKPQGEGTGLGLSVCFGIVTAHKGRIWVESDPERGATFVIELPIERREMKLERPRTTETQMLRLRQRLLAVDDEEMVRSVLERILSSFGFRVTAVASAEEARAILEQERIDIILCDLRMPGLGGPGLYEWVAAHNPELAGRMVFCTGDTVSHEAREFLRRTRCRVVAKPFNMSQLAQALSEIQYEIVNGSSAKR